MNTTPADQLTFRGNETAKRLHIGYNTSSNWGSLQSYTASGPGVLLLNPSGGNVGIGNAAAPSVALDVTGAIKASTTIAAGTSIAANGLSGYVFTGIGDTDGGLFSPADGTVTLKTDNTERVRVNPLGNVGIGTTNPQVPLSFSDAMGDKISLNGGPAGYGFGMAASTLWIHSDSSASDVAFGYGSALNRNETMRIKGNGNVGIGTTTPTVKLDVAGDIKSNGKSVPVAEENLRIVRGSISSNGAILAGGGFQVKYKDPSIGTDGRQGFYWITFNTPFSGAPTATVSLDSASMQSSMQAAGTPITAGCGSSRTEINVLIMKGSSETPAGFSFIAIGPR